MSRVYDNVLRRSGVSRIDIPELGLGMLHQIGQRLNDKDDNPFPRYDAHEAPFDESAFRLGVSRAGCPGGVMHALFEARSRHLYAGLEAGQVGSFLSGVLIGEEVHAMRQARPGLDTVRLVGADSLRESYTIALEAAGIRVESIDSDRATLAGVMAVAARHGSTAPAAAAASTCYGLGAARQRAPRACLPAMGRRSACHRARAPQPPTPGKRHPQPKIET